VKEWMMLFYLLLPTLRIALFIYCISTKLAKCAHTAMLYVLLPVTVLMTIVGTMIYSGIRSNEP